MSEVESEWVICETCEGRGKIRIGTCTMCKGTGVFEEAPCPVENCEFGTLFEPCPDRPLCNYGRKPRMPSNRNY